MKNTHIWIIVIFLIVMPVISGISGNSSAIWSYWTLDNTLADSLGRYNLTNTGTTYISSGKINGAYNWTGAAQYLKATDMNLNAPLCINLWFKSAVPFSSGDYNVLWRWADASYSGFDWSCSAGNSNDNIICYFDNTNGEPLLTSVQVTDTNMDNGNWHMFTNCMSASNFTIYVDGNWKANTAPAAAPDTNNNDNLYIGDKFATGETWAGAFDEFAVFNYTLSQQDITELYNNGLGLAYPFPGYSIPTILSINCTSATPNGDTTPPYTTADTTPTFRFDTNGSANCRIASTFMNYTLMGSSRNCTSGEGVTNHICSLTSQDELTLQNSYVYLACVNLYNSSLEANATLQMYITNLVENASLQIQQGIRASVVWPNAVVYSNQKVYLRNLANSQLLTTVSNVVVSGNQRWIINYGNTSIGLFNLTPAVYTLELVNSPIEQIPEMVAIFINSTKI